MSGEARKKISMTGDTKDARNFYAAKKREAEENIKWEFSFVDSVYDVSLKEKDYESES